MSIAVMLQKAFAQLRAFPRASRGNIAMIFGIALIPLCLAVGVGLDMSRAMITRVRMGAALDAAGLAVGSNPGMSVDDMKKLANQYFQQNYTADKDQYGTPDPVDIPPSDGKQTITLTTHVAMPTILMRIVGLDTMEVSVQSQITWGQTKLWVSLVLDNTGSMCQSDAHPNAGSPCPNPVSGTKIVALQSATHNLLTMLKNAAANPGDVQVSIIPFVKDVNAGTNNDGTSNAGKSWIDWTDWNAANGSCSISNKNSQSTCTGTHGTWTWTQGTCNVAGKTSQNSCQKATGTWTNASCSKSKYTSQSTCTSNHYVWTPASCDISNTTSENTCEKTKGTWTGTVGNCNISGNNTQTSCQNAVAVWTPNDHSTWNGCVADRGGENGPDTANNYDAENTAPVTGQANSQFPAEQYSTCPKSLMGLSYDWTALGNKVDAMVANGSTNQTIGLVWGWHALSQGDPMNATAVPIDTARYIIILSDGLNTQNRWDGNGSDQSPDVDNRMAAVCANAKADKITVYAVFVDIGGTQGNSQVLHDCATDPGKYYDLTSADQIMSTFQQIGTQITNLRVSL
jgi:Flp pilus assembly protein TadG